jgi:hypothetical protein
LITQEKLYSDNAFDPFKNLELSDNFIPRKLSLEENIDKAEDF